MEECEVPSLSEYDVEEYSFDADVIQRMELLVLNTLEWKMICVTPFTYLSYFATVFCGQFRPKDLINRAVQLISAIMAGINLLCSYLWLLLSTDEAQCWWSWPLDAEINVTDHRPSVLAAAAVLAAYNHHLTKQMLEIKINDVPWWGSVEKVSSFALSCLIPITKPRFFIYVFLSTDFDIYDRSIQFCVIVCCKRLRWNPKLLLTQWSDPRLATKEEDQHTSMVISIALGLRLVKASAIGSLWIVMALLDHMVPHFELWWW